MMNNFTLNNVMEAAARRPPTDEEKERAIEELRIAQKAAEAQLRMEVRKGSMASTEQVGEVLAFMGLSKKELAPTGSGDVARLRQLKEVLRTQCSRTNGMIKSDQAKLTRLGATGEKFGAMGTYSIPVTRAAHETLQEAMTAASGWLKGSSVCPVPSWSRPLGSV